MADPRIDQARSERNQVQVELNALRTQLEQEVERLREQAAMACAQVIATNLYRLANRLEALLTQDPEREGESNAA
jgi:hypothetical protein